MSIDPRGPRFSAWLTSIVLATVLLTGSGWLLLAQAVVFASAVAFGMRRSPYGWLYRRLLAPRLGKPVEVEPEAPVRFAQTVGLAFALVGAVGFLSGATVVGVVATALALAAAFLNAAFGFCLGCEIYLTYLRLTRKGVTA
ncbi:MAG: DUF4395 domain-containing protein [Pseudonocardiales bacterium]|nr:MAG: DUF4395 domain-containing protein [Pseudonocardiales bacterium]